MENEEYNELCQTFMDVVQQQISTLSEYQKKELEMLKKVDTTSWPEREAKAKESYETLIKINQLLRVEMMSNLAIQMKILTQKTKK